MWYVVVEVLINSAVVGLRWGGGGGLPVARTALCRYMSRRIGIQAGEADSGRVRKALGCSRREVSPGQGDAVEGRSHESEFILHASGASP